MSKQKQEQAHDTPAIGESTINNADSTHKASVIPEEKPAFPFSPELLKIDGIVSPSAPTEGAVMPEGNAIPEATGKRGRGRPRKEGSAAPRKSSKPSAEEVTTAAQANAAIVMKALDLALMGVSGGEFSGDATMRALTEASLTEVMEEQGVELPAWARACVFGAIYSSAAFATPKAKSRLSGWWAKGKAWYQLARG